MAATEEYLTIRINQKGAVINAKSLLNLANHIIIYFSEGFA